MQICPKCFNGDQRLKPGSIASGFYCQGCGTRLKPEPPTPQQMLSQDGKTIAADAGKLQQALEANKAVVKSLYGAREQLASIAQERDAIKQERDALKAEVAAIKAALATAGLPEAPAAQAAPPALPAVDFHGVPLTPTGAPQVVPQSK